MTLISNKKLDFWINNKLNVLLIGKHGVGKTSIILDAFKRANLRYLYFSGSTMDPFIDFCGIPIKVDTDKESVIELIRPKHIQDANVQAIFIDEYNRTAKKIRNAVMELIQFKTINGKPISDDLQIVWAAVNPDSSEDTISEYDTDRLDPAQRDRFQVHVEIPYKCDISYFTSKYDENTAKAAIGFWNALDDTIRNEVSPRRLDYALEIWRSGGDLRDILPVKSNVSKLLNALAIGDPLTIVKELFQKKKKEEIVKYLSDENTFELLYPSIVKYKAFLEYFLPFFSTEKITKLFTTNKKVYDTIKQDIVDKKTKSPYVAILNEIKTANTNKDIVQDIDIVLQPLEPVKKKEATKEIDNNSSQQFILGHQYITSANTNATITTHNTFFDPTNTSMKPVVDELLLLEVAVSQGSTISKEALLRKLPRLLPIQNEECVQLYLSCLNTLLRHSYSKKRLMIYNLHIMEVGTVLNLLANNKSMITPSYLQTIYPTLCQVFNIK